MQNKILHLLQFNQCIYKQIIHARLQKDSPIHTVWGCWWACLLYVIIGEGLQGEGRQQDSALICYSTHTLPMMSSSCWMESRCACIQASHGNRAENAADEVPVSDNKAVKEQMHSKR